MTDLYIGQRASISKTFSTDDVKTFAEISGDYNPIHLNEEFASTTIFKNRIVHGFLYSSLISGVIANELPGPGSIYLHQEMDFLKPVYHNDTVTAIVIITAIDEVKKIIHLDTNCYKQNGNQVVRGKAIIKLV